MHMKWNRYTNNCKLRTINENRVSIIKNELKQKKKQHCILNRSVANKLSIIYLFNNPCIWNTSYQYIHHIRTALLSHASKILIFYNDTKHGNEYVFTENITKKLSMHVFLVWFSLQKEHKICKQKRWKQRKHIRCRQKPQRGPPLAQSLADVVQADVSHSEHGWLPSWYAQQ